MSADHNLETAVLEARPGLIGILCCDHARQVTDGDRPAGKPLAEGFEVLAGQKCRRADDGHLLTGHGDDEGSPQRHLGLAKADVATDQPVHGRALGQIGQDIADGVQLVVGFLIGEAGTEFVEQPLRRDHDLALAQGPFGGQRDQALGHFAQTGPRLRLAALPTGAAQPVQLHALGLGAVAGQQVDVLDREIQLGIAGIGQLQTVVGGLLDVEGTQAFVASDAMVEVDHQVARGQGRGLGEEVGGAALFPWPSQPVAEDIGLGDDDQVPGLEPRLNRQHSPQVKGVGRRLDVGPVTHGHDRVQAMVRQHGGQAFRRPLAPGGKQHLAAGLPQAARMGGNRLEQIDAVLGTLGGERPAQPPTRIISGAAQGAELDDVAMRQRRGPVPGGQVQGIGRQGVAATGAASGSTPGRLAPRFKGVHRQVPTLAAGLIGLAVQIDDGVGRQIVEQRLQLRVEQRQPVLQTLTTRALTDGGVEGIIARRPEALEIAGAEARYGLGIQQGLGHRGQLHGGQLAGRALGGRIEGADRLQLLPEHVEAYRLVETGRIDVDHPAPNGIFAALGHGRGADIAIGGEIGLESRRIEVTANMGLESGRGRYGARWRPLHGGAHGGDNQARSPGRTAPGQQAERRHALRRDRG